ncbi:MAG: SprT protein [Parvicellaceae bacterium]|jgi:SprT protein
MKMKINSNLPTQTSDAVLQELTYLVPGRSHGYVTQLISTYNIKFKISRPRKTKLGDYRFDPRTKVHSISVNSDLNPFAFLITLIHELAHYRQHVGNRRRVAPHGDEWKTEFRTLMAPILEENIFPMEVAEHLKKHMINPKASCSDIHLMRLLEPYNEEVSLKLEDLQDGVVFQIENGKIFKRGQKGRTRFQCVEISTNRKWFVHALTKVQIVNETVSNL